MNERDALAERDAIIVLDTPAEPVAPAEPVPELDPPTAPAPPNEQIAPPAERPDAGFRGAQTQEETGGAALSLTEAALATGRHRSTLRRYVGAERFPNAYRGPGGAWRIPIADVLNAGLLPYPRQVDPQGTLAGLETALERLKAENAELRHRLDMSDALAEERAERIEDLRLYLGMLTPTDPPEEIAEEPESAVGHFVWSGEITRVGSDLS